MRHGLQRSACHDGRLDNAHHADIVAQREAAKAFADIGIQIVGCHGFMRHLSVIDPHFHHITYQHAACLFHL